MIVPYFFVSGEGMETGKRLNALQQHLRKFYLDALLITHLPNIFYLTGFTGSSAALMVFHRSAVFLTDGRYTEQAAHQVTNARIQPSKNGLIADAAGALLARGVRQVGFETRHLTHELYSRLRKTLGHKAGLRPCVGWVEELRLTKTPAEVEKIRISLRAVMAAFEETLSLVRPGIRESELSAELEYRMKRHGAQKVSFDLIVASGHRSALPHGVASEKKVRKNEFLVFDLGAILGGYSSDFTRTIYVGCPPAKAREIYQIVRESQECAIAGVSSGVPASQIDHLARSFIQQRGYGKFFVHSTGHGIGVEVHEAPLISARSKAVLAAGQAITIEPGIYLPRWGGVRIEDIVVVGERGCRNLTTAGKDLIAI